MPNAQNYISFQQHITRKCLAAGRAINSGQVLSMELDKESYPGPPHWGLGMGLTLLLQKLNCLKILAVKIPWPKMGLSAIENEEN
jgi:hypothetical protein